jgi:hypothetical protein
VRDLKDLLKMCFARLSGVNRFWEISSDDKAIEEAERAGFDLSLVDVSLRLSYEQRVLQHAGALELALELRNTGRKHYAQSALVAEPAR